MPAAIHERPADGDYNPYFNKYISLVPSGDLVACAEGQVASLRALLGSVSEDTSHHRYAPGKWSVREVVGHLTDVERVFSFRATAFSRRDPARLPSYDQDVWLPAGEYDDRPLSDLLDEWEAARRSTIALMRGMPGSALGARGVASDSESTALAMLTIPVGHLEYHLKLFAKDYGLG